VTIQGGFGDPKGCKQVELPFPVVYASDQIMQIGFPLLHKILQLNTAVVKHYAMQYLFLHLILFFFFLVNCFFFDSLTTRQAGPAKDKLWTFELFKKGQSFATFSHISPIFGK